MVIIYLVLLGIGLKKKNKFPSGIKSLAKSWKDSLVTWPRFPIDHEDFDSCCAAGGGCPAPAGAPV